MLHATNKDAVQPTYLRSLNSVIVTGGLKNSEA